MTNEQITLRAELLALLDEYVAAIDEDRLESWPEFFVEECLYEIVPKENADLGLEIGIMRCENRRMMRDRVISLRNANIFAPATYRHFLSGFRLLSHDAETAEFSCNYLVINSDQLGQSIVYQTGRYQDRAVRTADGWRFTSKRAVYDTSRVQTLLAIPV